jgi:hypothetical protein
MLFYQSKGFVMSKTPLVSALKVQLEAKQAKLEAELAPIRELYEKLVNDPKLAEAKAAILRINAELGPIKNELAAIVRAEGTKSITVEPGIYSK